MVEPARADEVLPEGLIPLRKAAALAYEHVIGRVGQIDPETALSVMAQALCDLSPLYTFDEGKQRVTLLGSRDLQGGRVCDGGSKLSFDGGRPDLDRVAIKAGDVRKVIQTLIDCGISFGEIEVLHPAGMSPKEHWGPRHML